MFVNPKLMFLLYEQAVSFKCFEIQTWDWSIMKCFFFENPQNHLVWFKFLRLLNFFFQSASFFKNRVVKPELSCCQPWLHWQIVFPSALKLQLPKPQGFGSQLDTHLRRRTSKGSVPFCQMELSPKRGLHLMASEEPLQECGFSDIAGEISKSLK